MSGRGAVRVPVVMDTADVQRGTKRIVKELDQVNRAASASSTKAAAGSVKALSGVLRMIESGKVSAKGIDKIGRSASGALGLMSPIGVALGLGAVPALSDGVVFAIGAIKKSLTPLETRIKDVAAALDDLTKAQLDLVDANLGIVDANGDLTKSLGEVDAAQKEVKKTGDDYQAALKGTVVDTDKVTKLTVQYHNATRAVSAAVIRRDSAERHLTDAVKKHGQGSIQAADATGRLTIAEDKVRAAEEKRKGVLRDLRAEKHGHKATEEELTKITDKHTAAQKKAEAAALSAAHAQAAVTRADMAQDDAKSAVSKSTGEFEKKLKALTATANANNVTMQHTSGRGTQLAVDQAKAATDVAKGLRTWANSQKGLSDATKEGALRAADLIDKTHKIPKDISTTFSQPGQAKANKATDLYRKLLAKIKPAVSTKVEAPGLNRALGDAKGLYGALQRLDGKTVTTRIVNVTTNRNQREGSGTGTGPHGATGLRIGGPPNSRDDVNVNISQGEVVLNPRQQSLVDDGMTIDDALAATGAPTIFGGGRFAGGGKSKKRHHSLAYQKAKVALEAAQKRLSKAKKGTLEYRQAQVAIASAQAALRKASSAEKGHAANAREERNQKILDSAKGRFGARMSADDLALAKAESTGTFTDDTAVLGSEQTHIIARIREIQKLRARKGLTRDQKQDLNDEEAALIRQLADIGGQLAGGGGTSDTGGGAAEPDSFALDRAQQAGFNAGLGRAAGYVFGGPGDIGSGGGSALGAAGSIPALHVESLTFTNSVQNQGQIARASNVGNDVISGGRIASSRSRVAF